MALTWRNDGPLGKENEGCSEVILLLWLTEEGNYALYRSLFVPRVAFLGYLVDGGFLQILLDRGESIR
jgi:hypothetical protein